MTEMTEITEREYWEQVESILSRIEDGEKPILSRIKDGTDIELEKHIADKLNNAWHEGISIDEWVDAAGIRDYLDQCDCVDDEVVI